MNLPEELVDIILGYLSLSPGTLLNCTMVKRSWTHIARAHLLYCHTFRLSTPSTTSSLTAFTECIHTDPPLAQRVSILELRKTQISEYRYDTSKDTGISDEDLLLAPLLPRLIRVQELRLIGFNWTTVPQIVSSAILALLSGSMISTLHFEVFRMTSTTEFARFISSSRSLKTLRLVQIYVPQDPNDAVALSVGRRDGATLQSLELGTMLNSHILDALFRAENTLNFSALRKLCLVHANHPSVLKKLVNVVGPSIEELILSTRTVTGAFDTPFGETTLRNTLEPQVPFDLSLACMPKLLRLELTDGMTQEALESLFGTLKGPHPLREIVVHEDDWVRHALNAAQAYYLQPALGKLTRVEYRIMDHNQWEGMKRVHQEAFAMLREKGVFFLVQEEFKTTWPRWGLQRYA
ncbi:hypothetical protein C0995_008874 [Termitomyces sp. Mi166|nr:hypothetical protein C0995_008874 [Termitomyces sp. Mi166\